MRRSLSDCQKSLAEFASADANRIKYVFPGDMCVGKNTYQPANVRAVRLWRTASALQQAAAPFVKEVLDFFDKLSAASGLGAALSFVSVHNPATQNAAKCAIIYCIEF